MCQHPMIRTSTRRHQNRGTTCERTRSSLRLLTRVAAGPEQPSQPTGCWRAPHQLWRAHTRGSMCPSAQAASVKPEHTGALAVPKARRRNHCNQSTQACLLFQKHTGVVRGSALSHLRAEAGYALQHCRKDGREQGRRRLSLEPCQRPQHQCQALRRERR